MRTVAIALLPSVFVVPGDAGGQTIHGTVLEAGSGAAIAGATVELLAPDSTPRASATTAANGWFTLSTPREGRFLIRTSHPSYAGAVEAVRVRQREVLSVMLRMSRAAIPLEPLVVTARSYDNAAGFRLRARSGVGRYITRAEIDKRNPNHTSDLLKLTSEVRFEYVQQGLFTRQVPMMRNRAGRLEDDDEFCAPTIFLDGMKVVDSSAEVGFDVDDLLTTDQLEGIEIYRSHLGVPLELAALGSVQNQCGIIALWSRTPPGRHLTWPRLAIGSALAAIVLLVR